MNPIPYGKQSIDDADIHAVVEALKSDFLTQGPSIESFEQAFATYVGATYAVAVANGTAALHLSVLGMGLKPGERVITTPITFAASANCILYAGGEVDFVDIDPDSYLMDLNKLREKLESKPRGYYSGLIPVDFAGYPVNLEELKQICNEFGLWMVEDACHAPGGYFMDNQGNEQKCGNGAYANAAIFSFHPVKHIATGEGGMITTNDHALYESLLKLRTHGITKDPQLLKENHGGWYYEMQELGYNYRLTDIQAALGISQLQKADQGLISRKEIARLYDHDFSGIPNIKTPKVSQDVHHAYHLYVIQVPDRLGLYNYLREHKIFTQVHYIPVHTLPYYKNLGWKKGDFPIAETYYQHCLSLPMYPTLSEVEQSFVIEKINYFLDGDGE
jgi:UDP-4-amino-4,6-dideoxy-N-acetyl-beta-L-altrosamine transaminase